MHRQLGDGPIAPDCRYRHLRLERRAVFLPCPLHVLLPRYPRFLGAGLHLSHLSHFRGPAHPTVVSRDLNPPRTATCPAQQQQQQPQPLRPLAGSDATPRLGPLSPIPLRRRDRSAASKALRSVFLRSFWYVLRPVLFRRGKHIPARSSVNQFTHRRRFFVLFSTRTKGEKSLLTLPTTQRPHALQFPRPCIPHPPICPA